MNEVVAAIIWDRDKIMICKRPASKACGLRWEFAGGKVEPGETNEQALIRECWEELGVRITVGDQFMEVIHEYPETNIRLTLYNATIVEGLPQKLEHIDIKWITPHEIDQYDFCSANVDMIKKIRTIKKYNKLVRDRIPEIIEATGKTCVTQVLSDEEYLKMIDLKLDEELAEYHVNQNIEELADLLEVIHAAAVARGYSAEKLEQIRAEKAAKRGDFKKKLLLKGVFENPKF